MNPRSISHLSKVLIISIVFSYQYSFADEAVVHSPPEGEPKEPVGADQASSSSDPKEEKKKVEVNQLQQKLDQYVASFAGGAHVDLVSAYQDVIQALLNQKKIDNDEIWRITRAINRAFDGIPECQNMYEVEYESSFTPLKDRPLNDFDKSSLGYFCLRVAQINEQMLHASYSDWIHSNKNLSYQIEKRLPTLLGDALDLLTTVQSKPNYQRAKRRHEFLSELEIMRNRYMNSNRFIAGIGLSYAYMPTVVYKSASRVGFSPFQTSISGGSDALFYTSVFDRKGFSALNLTAKVPFLDITVALPDLEATSEFVSGVRQREIDGVEETVLYRSEVQSTLEFTYDVSVDLSVTQLVEFFGSGGKFPANAGFGFGLVGMNVSDSVKHDVRFQTDPTLAFNDLPSNNVVEESHNRDYLTSYYSLFTEILIGDEFSLGIKGKWYQPSSNDGNEIEAEDYVISMYLNYYPTLDWLKF